MGVSGLGAVGGTCLLGVAREGEGGIRRGVGVGGWWGVRRVSSFGSARGSADEEQRWGR